MYNNKTNSYKYSDVYIVHLEVSAYIITIITDAFELFLEIGEHKFADICTVNLSRQSL